MLAVTNYILLVDHVSSNTIWEKHQNHITVGPVGGLFSHCMVCLKMVYQVYQKKRTIIDFSSFSRLKCPFWGVFDIF